MPNDTTYDPNNIFARILRGELPCHRVFEDDVALAFMDVMPQADGHTLVVPKAPAIDMLTLDASLWGAFMPRVQTVAAAVKKGMNAEGVLLQQFNGAAAGQTVFHLHFHILPRWSGIALRRHSGQMEQPETLAANAARIAAAL